MRSQYPLRRQLGGTQSQSDIFEKKNLLLLLGIKPQIIQPVAL